jgi:hypothetical protein
MFSGKTHSIIALVALVAAGPAAALGFGEFRAQVVLGQTLNLALPVTLGEGETLAPDCASAEVVDGESRLPPGSVRVRVTQGRDIGEVVLRISTSVAIEEPILTVTVTAGCPTRVTRTLVLLADPPLVSTASAEPAPPPPASEPARPGAAPMPVARPGVGSPAGVAAQAKRPAPPPRATARTAAPRPPRAVAARPRAAVVSAAPRTATAPAPSASVPARAEGRPRLQLDMGQLSVDQAAALAAQAQASAAQSAAQAAAAQAEAAASAAQQRVKDLEAEMARVRADAKAQADALVALRQQIAQDQSQRQQQGWLVPSLTALAVVLALLAIWLARRQRDQPSPAQAQQWWDKAGAPSQSSAEDSGFRSSTFRTSTQGSPHITSAPVPLGGRSGAPSTRVGLDSLISPPTVAAPMPVTIPALAQREDEGSRAVSVDEQIDLEQQADFFVALGHDESAIDLLMAHLRSTGGSTPLPFLKLLEIHRRRGDREAYERTRIRFNQRFNSVAPEWMSDPGAGRSLEDYPLVVGRVQHVWPRPLDAMAELESLLFRRGTGSETFDLPAYHEVLFLYQMARDLHQIDQPDTTTDVDVLLPIGATAAAVPEGSIVLRPEFNSGQAVTLDLDLTNRPPAAEAAPPAPADLEIDLGSDASAPERNADDTWPIDPDDKRRE